MFGPNLFSMSRGRVLSSIGGVPTICSAVSNGNGLREDADSVHEILKEENEDIQELLGNPID